MRTTREELHRLVWSKPLLRLAKEYGLSDVGLAKVCRRHDIPLPKVGHWSKIAAGHHVPVPSLGGDGQAVVEFQGSPSLKNTPLDPSHKARLAEALAKRPIEAAAADVAQLAPWTRKTAQALGRKPDGQGWLYGRENTFSVRISQGTRERAIRILHCLETALGAAGMQWETSEKHRCVVGKLLGQTVRFALSENFHRTEHVTKHPRFDWNERTYAYHFTGDLTIRIDGWYEGRKSWSDGKTQRLEEKLPQVVEGMFAAAEAMKRRADEQAEWKRRFEEEQELRRQQEIATRKEKEFLDSALEEAAAWQQADLLRRYVGHLREIVKERGLELTAYGQEWLDRIEQAAARRDPTRKRLGAGNR